MADTYIKISELEETTLADDSSYIPIDNGNHTYKITVENYNSGANATAQSYAEAAAASADDAEAAKTAAETAETETGLIRTATQQYATAASGSASAAASSAVDALNYADSAASAAANAADSAQDAAESYTNAAEKAVLSESWAVGGTNTRTGEDTNNSQYYAAAATSAAENAEDQVELANAASTAASGSAVDAAASATEASGYADDASDYATAASGSATAAATSATQSANSAGAAATSATNAAASATAAAGSASSAATQANNAAQSATTAGGYATQAASSASDASGYATNAANSATAAAGSATTASNQATAAAGSATAAAASASDAADSAADAAESAATFTTDDTLSIAGKAADAKAAGDMIAAVQAEIPELDNWLTTPGAAAEAKHTGDRITEVEDDVADLKSALTNVYEKTGSENIYDPSMPTTVGWLTDTGAISDTGTGANFATTDYIPVDKNTDYIVKNVRVGYAGGSPGSRILVALYDASKTYISGTYQNVVSVTPMQVSVSTGQASYLRVSTLPQHLEAVPQYGSVSTEVVYSDADLSQYIPYVPSVYENRMRIVSGYGAVTENEYDADMADVDERIDNVQSNLVGISEVEYSKNIYDRNSQLTTGWLTNTGAVDATGTGANFATTDYIKVEKNTDYIIANERMNIVGNVAGSRILIALYDADKNYISGSFQNVVNVSPMQVTFNSSDAVYLRVSTLPQHMGIPTSEFALIVQKGSTLDGYTTYWVKHISNLYPQDNILFGKKYVACGDSLTAGDFTGYTDESGKTGVLSDAFSPEYGSYKTYPYWIASRNGMTLVNSGINGSVMAISKEYIDGTKSAIDYRSPFSLQRYKDIPADADYITLWFGVNDKDHTYLGTISDTTNETFYGAWNVVLPYLMENHPKAKIGIVITFGIPDSPYTQAVREVAEKWGVPYFDFPRGKQSPIIIRNKDTDYAVDQSIVDWKFDYYSVAETNHHPNLIAHEYESTCLEAWLRSL